MKAEVKMKLAELVLAALEQKGAINIYFGQYNQDGENVLRQDVEEKAKEIADLLGVNVEERNNECANSLNVSQGMDINIQFSYLTPEHQGYKLGKFMEEDIFIPQEECDDVFSYLSRCHDNGFIPDIDHLSDKFPNTEWDDLEQEVKGFARIHDLSETKILWVGELSGTNGNSSEAV